MRTYINNRYGSGIMGKLYDIIYDQIENEFGVPFRLVAFESIKIRIQEVLKRI